LREDLDRDRCGQLALDYDGAFSSNRGWSPLASDFLAVGVLDVVKAHHVRAAFRSVKIEFFPHMEAAHARLEDRCGCAISVAVEVAIDFCALDTAIRTHVDRSFGFTYAIVLCAITYELARVRTVATPFAYLWLVFVVVLWEALSDSHPRPQMVKSYSPLGRGVSMIPVCTNMGASKTEVL